NGEITDPPASDTYSAVRYAHAIPRAVSPVSASTDETLFCPTCLQNQHLLTQLLASYLPPSTDTNDAAYEAQYPHYRARLEEQYPQVCEECEPRVRERIRATGYAAKTDHLRRMMERTRENRANTKLRNSGWRGVVMMAGACGWWTSLAGQTVWNIMGAMVTDEYEDGLRSDRRTVTLSTCVHQCLRYRAVDLGCIASAAPMAGLALLLGAIFIWWNNRLKERARGSDYRMVGLSDYYKLQVVVLVVRICAWTYLQHDAAAGLSAAALRAAHLSMLAFLAISTMVSMRIVKIDKTPRVSWQENPEPLTQLRPPAKERTLWNGVTEPNPGHSDRFNPQSSAFIQPFPINNLAPASQQLYPPPYNPPTPPPEDEPDAMDWTPTQKSFQPAPSHSLSRETRIPLGPSPFYGRLPAAPQSQAQRLRNPQNQPSFRKASTGKQQNFFNSMTGRQSSNEPQGRNPERPENEGANYFEMAPPKFFPRNDFRADTGLESLFDSAFSLRDEPPEIRAARERQQHLARCGDGSTAPGAWGRITGICSLGAALLAWKVAIAHPQSALHLRLGALGVAATIAGRALLEATGKTKPIWSLSDIFLFTIELAVSILLGSVASSHDSTNEAYDMMGMILLGGIMVQELWLLISAPKRLPRQSSVTAPATAPPSEHSNAEAMLSDASVSTGSNVTPQGSRTSYNPLTIETREFRSIHKLVRAFAWDWGFRVWISFINIFFFHDL
ncbi:MAG: hypothetical protein M1830_005083, partial [Pleopsidium flavum]